MQKGTHEDAFGDSNEADPGPGSAARILIIGNSHTQMIKDAVIHRATLGNPSANVEICWLQSRGKGLFGDTTREQAIDKIQSLRPSDLLVMTLLGTLHNKIGLFIQEPPLMLFSQDKRPAEFLLGTQLVPYSVMRDMFKDHTENNQAFDQMVSIAPCKVLHFSPPPPKESFLKDGKTKIVDGSTIQLKFAPKDLRLALWKLEQSVVARYLESIKVTHYETLPGTTTPDGFLETSFHAKDATHANRAFGEKLLLEFERILPDLPQEQQAKSRISARSG